jgi:signal transduction histidine kinase
MANPKVTYASTNDDLKFLAGLGVPVEDIAHRMGRSEDAVEAMLSKDQKTK